MNAAGMTQVPRHEPTAGSHPASTRVPTGHHPPAYTTREFLDDQRWLLRQLDVPGPFEDRVERIDGWYLVLHPGSTCLDARDARVMFGKRPGPRTGARRLSVFLATIRFLDERRADIERCGLSLQDDPLTVREELVDFLIARYSGPGREIPECALTRFLDEWGHRWI